MADATQSANYWRLLTDVENAVSDPAALGAAQSRIEAANLADEDRTELIGLCENYRSDQEKMADPWDAYARGDGPLPEGEPPASEFADPDAEADAEADREDGFKPATA